MTLRRELLSQLNLTDLATEAAWPSALVAGAAHYSEAAQRPLHSPIDGAVLGRLAPATIGIVQLAVEAAHGAYLKWRVTPATVRSELVRRIGLRVRERRAALAELIVLEVGKNVAEANREVQSWVDACDHAAGLVHRFAGHTLPASRSGCRLMTQWHPLGAVGVISTFARPMGAGASIAMTALACGDSVIWKPSPRAPLCALTAIRLIESVVTDMSACVPVHLCQLLLGDEDAGEMLSAHPMVPLVCATVAPSIGRAIAAAVAPRFGRTVLALGGNAAAIVAETANIEHVVAATVPAVAACAGQCGANLRRLIVHERHVDTLTQGLCQAFADLPIGDPRHRGDVMGPLIDAEAFWAMQAALQAAEQQGGRVIFGGHRLESDVPERGYYVRPALVWVPDNLPIVQEATPAPIVYLMPYSELFDAIELQNSVPQGFGSALFTECIGDAEQFLGPAGSDCGIVNVNVAPDVFETSSAVGGDKASGGGRESGFDNWMQFMRCASSIVAPQ